MQQRVVQVSVLQAPVELVRPAAEDHCQPAPRCVSEFRRHAGGVGFHFRDGVDARRDHSIRCAHRAGYRLFGAEPVKVIAHGPLALAVEVKPIDHLGVRQVRQEAKRQFLEHRDLHHDIAPQYTAGHRRLRLQHRSLPLYLYRLGAGADFQTDVDARLVVGAQLNAVANISLESRGLDRHVVNTGPEIGDIVVSLLVG